MRRSAGRRPATVVLLLLLVVVPACGSDRGDDTAREDTTTTTARAGGGDSTFGTLDSPCGDGDATGATDQGVTDTEIVIGYGDDAGFQQSPGLSHEVSDAMRAFIKWCNAQGGINGREVVGNYYDAKITEVVNAVTAACQDVFMLVGEGWALDASQEEARLGCDLPAVPAYAASANFANAPLMYSPVPNPVDIVSGASAALIAEAFPEEVKHASMVYGNFATTIDVKDKYTQAYPEFGFEFDCLQEYNILGEADWKPLAQKLESCGVEVVVYAGQAYPHGQNLVDAAAQIGYRPIWLWDANNYLESFAKWNTHGNGDTSYVRTVFTPFEQADSNPATRQYMDIVQGDGGDISQLGQQAASAFLLWATAANECGSELTRACVMSELKQIDEWDGGGMHAPGNPAENLPSPCVMILKMEGTRFVQAYPEKEGEFACSDEYLVTLSGRVVDQVELGPDRVSRKFRK